ncbi:MAG: hypothetical protein N2645_23495 [Clostridia bacterium]|nr:hypothetical protein [Clostridia bacterium]
MNNVNNYNQKQINPAKNFVILTIGWVCAIVSTFFYPFVFGVVGVIMGIIATKYGSKKGLPLIVTSIICMSIGLIFGGVLLNYLTHYMGF